jgi:hypothetical protein
MSDTRRAQCPRCGSTRRRRISATTLRPHFTRGWGSSYTRPTFLVCPDCRRTEVLETERLDLGRIGSILERHYDHLEKADG